MRKPARRPVWFFDLDNTLHDASHRVFPEINRQMTHYVAEQLGLDLDAASALRQAYWHRYGATMLGMVRHHNINVADFLQRTHCFPDLPALLRAERRIHEVLARLPGRKVLVTNAPAHYANAVLRHLKIHTQFDRCVSVESMRLHGVYRPKPSRSLMLHWAARLRITPTRVILVDDSLSNLRAAKACRMQTARIGGASQLARVRRGCRPSYVDWQVHSVHQLARRSWQR